MTEGQNTNQTAAHNRRDMSAAVNPLAVLHELFDLLEDYGPVWYTQETHDRAFQALVQHSH